LLELARQLARRDVFTRAHSGRVSRLSVEVGQRIGLSAEEIEITRLAGLLHDIGKLEIPTSILHKPSALNPAEAELVRHHPEIGASLVRPYIGGDVVNSVRHHHERVDGTGYPDKVGHQHLPLIARLVPVVDTYDALVSDRPYRPGRSKEEAFRELRAVAGTQLDADLVEALIEVERAKSPIPAGLAALLPLGPLLRRAQHVLHVSVAPAATVVTAFAVTGAASLGIAGTGGRAPEPPAGSAAVAGQAIPGSTLSPGSSEESPTAGASVGAAAGASASPSAAIPKNGIAHDVPVTSTTSSLAAPPVRSLPSGLTPVPSAGLGIVSPPALPSPLPGLSPGVPPAPGTPITVPIVVNPGSTSTAVNPSSLGLVRVAILSTATFDAASVDTASVCFGHSPPDPGLCATHLGAGFHQDVNGDGRPDLVLDFSIAQSGIRRGDLQACLTGRTVGGQAIRGCASIVTVGL
jgi:hypothetical protein